MRDDEPTEHMPPRGEREPDLEQMPELDAEDAPVPEPVGTIAFLSSLGPSALFLGGAAIAFPLLMIAAFTRLRPWIETQLDALGTAAPLVFALVLAVITGFALSPTWLLAGFAGYMFGMIAGSMVAVAGITGGAAIGYTLAKLVIGTRVRESIAATQRGELIRAALIDRSFRDEVLAITLVRFPPSSPFAGTNFILAAVGARFLAFIIATPIGMAPRTILAAVLGAAVRTAGEVLGEKGPDRPDWVVYGGIGVSVVIVFVLYQLGNRWISQALVKATEQPQRPED